LENLGLVSLQVVESNLDKVFLRIVLGEAILRKSRLRSNLVAECTSAKQRCVRYLWLDGLRLLVRRKNRGVVQRKRCSISCAPTSEASFSADFSSNYLISL